jgi:hypothetical protein
MIPTLQYNPETKEYELLENPGIETGNYVEFKSHDLAAKMERSWKQYQPFAEHHKKPELGKTKAKVNGY